MLIIIIVVAHHWIGRTQNLRNSQARGSSKKACVRYCLFLFVFYLYIVIVTHRPIDTKQQIDDLLKNQRVNQKPYNKQQSQIRNTHKKSAERVSLKTFEATKTKTNHFRSAKARSKLYVERNRIKSICVKSIARDNNRKYKQEKLADSNISTNTNGSQRMYATLK